MPAPEDAPENTPTDPAEKPVSLALKTGLPAGTPKLLQQTPIATTTCADEDRWVFMQDVAGNIRAAHYSQSSSNWNFSPDQHNFTAAKLGTPMSASCVNITEEVGLDWGIYVSNASFIPSRFFWPVPTVAFFDIYQPIQQDPTDGAERREMERFAGGPGLEATQWFQLPKYLHAFSANASSRRYWSLHRRVCDFSDLTASRASRWQSVSAILLIGRNLSKQYQSGHDWFGPSAQLESRKKVEQKPNGQLWRYAGCGLRFGHRLYLWP